MFNGPLRQSSLGFKLGARRTRLVKRDADLLAERRTITKSLWSFRLDCRGRIDDVGRHYFLEETPPQDNTWRDNSHRGFVILQGGYRSGTCVWSQDMMTAA